MSACSGCGTVFVDARDVISCINCEGTFHSGCSRLKSVENLIKLGKKKEQWYCDNCKMEKKMEAMLSKFKDELLKASLNNTNELKQSVELISAKFDEQKILLERLEGQFKEIKNENALLKAEVKTLTRINNDLLTEQRRNNVILNNIPVTTNEDVKEVIKAVGKSVQIQIDEQSIDFCHRLPDAKNKTSPPILCRFVRRESQEALINAYRTAARENGPVPLSTLSKTFNEGHYYVNYHLTPLIAELWKNTRLYAKNNNYKFAWMRGGRIYIRQSEGERAIRIISSEQLLSNKK